MKRFVATMIMTAVLGSTFAQPASAGGYGVRLNGLQLNGIGFNGIVINGFMLNGQRFNSLAPEKAVGTAANPFSGLDGGALGQ